jgi:hypothetical protein
MMTIRHRKLAASVILTLLISGSQLTGTPSWAAAIKNGDACSPEGATFKQSSTEFVCTKSGSKTVWKSKPKATPTAEAKFVMPKVVGMNLQLAQDLLQSKGSYVMDQEDYKGLNRFQINDSNWKVCKQTPAAGKSVPISTVVTLYSVKLAERC